MAEVNNHNKESRLSSESNPHGSFFDNNHVIVRDNESSPIYQVGAGLFSLKMDSYLIIPKEKITEEELTKLGYSHLFQ
jgi:hypothetical protein